MLIDFGEATLCQAANEASPQHPNVNITDTQRGTFKYMAPETIDCGDNFKYTDRADVYGLGAVALECILRVDGKNLMVLPERKEEQAKEMGDENPLKDVICKCLSRDPQSRPSSAELVEVFSEVKGKVDFARRCDLQKLQRTEKAALPVSLKKKKKDLFQ